MALEGFSVRGGGFRFRVHDQPPHPQAGDPVIIEVCFWFVFMFKKMEKAGNLFQREKN